MYCEVHERPKDMDCEICRKPLCKECAEFVEGGWLCHPGGVGLPGSGLAATRRAGSGKTWHDSTGRMSWHSVCC